jgi:hypothetical protein
MFACGRTSLCELLTIVPTWPCPRKPKPHLTTPMLYKMFSIHRGHCKSFQIKQDPHKSSIEIFNMRPFFDASELPRADLFKSTSQYPYGLRNNCSLSHGLREHIRSNTQQAPRDTEIHGGDENDSESVRSQVTHTVKKGMSTTMERTVSKAYMTTNPEVTIPIRELEPASC